MTAAAPPEKGQSQYPESAEGWRKVGGKLAEARLDFEARTPWDVKPLVFSLQISARGGRWRKLGGRLGGSTFL